MQRVGSPCQLPRAEVGLTALLVQICEDEEQQDGNEPWDDRRCDDNTIHRVGVYRWPESPARFRGKTCGSMISQPRIRTQQNLSTVSAFDFFRCQRVAGKPFGGEASLTMSFSAPYHRKFDHV